MIAFRSALFNAVFYANLIIQMIVFTPVYFLMPPRKAFGIVRFWARSCNWWMKTIVGTTFTVEGLENLPRTSFILAPKHQSFWDVILLLPLLDHPVFILKRELMWIPLFGWYAQKQRMIPVNRNAKGKAMLDVMNRTRAEMATGRQLIIYPEGTRRPPGAEPLYKYGIARIYKELDLPVVPVALHAGLFWPRRKFLRFPGHFTVSIMKPIEPKLDADTFFQRLMTTMETESDRLLVLAAAENPRLPLPPTASQRLQELATAEDSRRTSAPTASSH